MKCLRSRQYDREFFPMTTCALIETCALWLNNTGAYFDRRQLLPGTAANCRNCREGMAAAVPLVLRTKRGRVPLPPSRRQLPQTAAKAI
jgi:hypothetical protein